MCTASWLIHPQGFELHFNRDESRRRGRAEPPAVFELAGVRVLAPRDKDGGGTWLGVNEFGLAVGLLNAGDAGLSAEAAESRGLLVRGLLDASGTAEALARLEGAELGRFRGFTVALFEPGRAPAARTWDGRALVALQPEVPLCSSSLDGGRAAEERRRVFARLSAAGVAPGTEDLARFQRSHEPERGPWSPCMHRVEAETVSASQVRVDARAVSLRYADGSPCTSAFGPWLELPRRGPGERGRAAARGA